MLITPKWFIYFVYYRILSNPNNIIEVTCYYYLKFSHYFITFHKPHRMQKASCYFSNTGTKSRPYIAKVNNGKFDAQAHDKQFY